MNQEKSNGLPLAGVFLAMFAWGIGPIFFLAVHVSTYSAIFYRAIMWPPILFLVIRLRHIQITRQTMKESLLPGIVFGASTMFGFIAWKETSIANATIIGNLSAALILFVAPRMLNEHVSRPQIVFSILSFAGVAGVVFGADGAGGARLSGDGFALLNAVFWAIYFVASKRARTTGISTWAYLFGISVSQLVVVVPLCLVFSPDIGKRLGARPRHIAGHGFNPWHDGTRTYGLGTSICGCFGDFTHRLTRSSDLDGVCLARLQPRCCAVAVARRGSGAALVGWCRALRR